VTLEYITTNPVTEGYERETTRRRQQRAIETAELGAMLQEQATIQGLRRSNEEEARQMAADEAGVQAFRSYQSSLSGDRTPAQRALMTYAERLAGEGQGRTALESIFAVEKISDTEKERRIKLEDSFMRAIADSKDEPTIRALVKQGRDNGLDIPAQLEADLGKLKRLSQWGVLAETYGLQGEQKSVFALEMESNGGDLRSALAKVPKAMGAVLETTKGYHAVPKFGTEATPLTGRGGVALMKPHRPTGAAGDLKVDMQYLREFDKALLPLTGGMTDDGVSTPPPYGALAAGTLRQLGHQVVREIGSQYTPYEVATIFGRIAQQYMVTPEDAFNRATLEAKEKFEWWASSGELGPGMTRKKWIEQRRDEILSERLALTVQGIRNHFTADANMRQGTPAPGTRGTYEGVRGTVQVGPDGNPTFVPDPKVPDLQAPVSGAQVRPIPQAAAPSGTALPDVSTQPAMANRYSTMSDAELFLELETERQNERTAATFGGQQRSQRLSEVEAEMATRGRTPAQLREAFLAQSQRHAQRRAIIAELNRIPGRARSTRIETNPAVKQYFTPSEIEQLKRGERVDPAAPASVPAPTVAGGVLEAINAKPTAEVVPPTPGYGASRARPRSVLERVQAQPEPVYRGSVTAEPEYGIASTTAEPEYGRDSITAEPVEPLVRQPEGRGSVTTEPLTPFSRPPEPRKPTPAPPRKPKPPPGDAGKPLLRNEDARKGRDELSEARRQLDDLGRQITEEERQYKELAEQVEIAQAKNEGVEPRRGTPQASMTWKPPAGEARFDTEAASYTKEGLPQRIKQVASQLEQTIARRKKALNKGNKGEADRLWKQMRNLQQEHGALMREQKRRREAPKDPERDRAQNLETRIRALKRLRDESRAQGRKEDEKRQQGLIDRLFNEQIPIIESIRKRDRLWAPE